MSPLQKWLSGSAQLKIATVGMGLVAIIYIVWSFGFASEYGAADIATPIILATFAVDMFIAILLFFITRFGKILTVLVGIGALITVIVTIANPDIEIMGIEVAGLFQASGVAIVWSIIEIIAAICVLSADDFKKRTAEN
jgi:hypothetical protein